MTTRRRDIGENDHRIDDGHDPRPSDQRLNAREEAFRSGVGFATMTCTTPMGIMVLRRGDAWTETRYGDLWDATTAEVPFTTPTIAEAEPHRVGDATQDQAYAQWPLVTDPPGVRAYLGVRLEDPETQEVMGTLGVLDVRPRAWSEGEVRNLQAVALLMADVVTRSRRAEGHGSSIVARRAARGIGRQDAATDEQDWAGLRDRLSDVLARIDRLQRRKVSTDTMDEAT